MILGAENLKKEDVLKAYKNIYHMMGADMLHEIRDVIYVIYKYSFDETMKDKRLKYDGGVWADCMALSTIYMCGYMRGKREERNKK